MARALGSVLALAIIVVTIAMAGRALNRNDRIGAIRWAAAVPTFLLPVLGAVIGSGEAPAAHPFWSRRGDLVAAAVSPGDERCQ